MDTDNYIKRNGFWWPKRDKECRSVVFNTAGDMLTAIAKCRNKRLVVQAGGNCGVWPAWLAGVFDSVVTFEPHPENFHCLLANVPANVIPCQAALDEKHGSISMSGDPKNCGAYQVEHSGSGIPSVTIDSFDLTPDYIVLDIEGLELKALKGAAETLARAQPVIQLEDKGLSEKYGTGKGEVVDYLIQEFGYKVEAEIHRDVILVPND